MSTSIGRPTPSSRAITAACGVLLLGLAVIGCSSRPDGREQLPPKDEQSAASTTPPSAGENTFAILGEPTELTTGLESPWGLTFLPDGSALVSERLSGQIRRIPSTGGGVLDYCRLNDITVQAWSPFQAGFFNGAFLGSPDFPEINAVIDRLAVKYDVPAIAIAVAWITRHPAQMQVVLGTTTPERVAGAAQGSDVSLTKPEWYELFRAAGYRVP